MPDEILLELSQTLGRLEGKVDGLLREQQRVAEVSAVTASRVNELEAGISRVIGWASGAAAVIAFLVSWVKELVHR
jgi:hypothetical protein